MMDLLIHRDEVPPYQIPRHSLYPIAKNPKTHRRLCQLWYRQFFHLDYHHESYMYLHIRLLFMFAHTVYKHVAIHGLCISAC